MDPSQNRKIALLSTIIKALFRRESEERSRWRYDRKLENQKPMPREEASASRKGTKRR